MPEPEQRLFLGGALDPFGNQRGIERAGKRDDALCQRRARRILMHATREKRIELHDVWLEPQDVLERREAGADIVNRQAQSERRNGSSAASSAA